MSVRVNLLFREGAWAAIFVLLLQSGCGQVVPGEIPVTTRSDKAREAFLKARQKYENLRADESRELFDTALRHDSTFALAHFYRARTRLTAIDYEYHLDQALTLSSNASDGERMLIQASAALEKGDSARHVGLLDKLVRQYPQDKRAHMMLAEAYYFRKDFQRAIAELERAIELDRDFAPPYNLLGYSHRALEDYEQAESALLKYVQLIPNEPNPYDSMGDLYTKMGRHEDAISYYERALELNPGFAISLGNIGINLIFLGRYDEGREALRKAMELAANPTAKLAHMQRYVRSYVYEGKYHESLSQAHRMLAIAIESHLPWMVAEIHWGISLIALEIKDFEQAERNLQESKIIISQSDLSPEEKEAFASDAVALEAILAAWRMDFEGAFAKAEEYRTRIEESDHSDRMSAYHVVMGRLHLERDNYGDARQHLSMARQNDPYCLYYLGVTESKLGNMERAQELFSKAANWNEDSYGYVFVRAKAMAALKQ